METIIMQPWVSLRVDQSILNVNQEASLWLDLEDCRSV